MKFFYIHCKFQPHW